MRDSTGPSTYPGVTWGRKRPNISLSSESSSFILTRAKLALGTHVRFLGTGIHRLGEMTSSELNERGSIWDGAGWARIWGHLRMWAPNEVEAWAKATTHPSQSLALGAVHTTGELPARLPQGCDLRRAGGRRLWRDNSRRSTSTRPVLLTPL